MNYNSQEHIRPIHHSCMHPNLSSSQIRNELNKKIITSEQFCNVEMKVPKYQDSPLAIFSRRLQNSLKQKQKELYKHLKGRRNSFLKEQELKIKQTKKILIIQQKINNQSGFSLNVIAAKPEDRIKGNASEKKRSFQQRSVERVPLISYPVERMTGFRKKLINFLENEEVKNVENLDVFQKVSRRKSLQRRIKMQPLQDKVKMRIQTEPGNLGQVYFVIPSNLQQSKKKLQKKITSIFEVSRQYRAGSFRRFSKQHSKEEKAEQKEKMLLLNHKQKSSESVSRTKQGSIGPWNEQAQGEQF